MKEEGKEKLASNATKKKTAAAKGSAASKRNSTGSSRNVKKTAAVSTKKANKTVKEPVIEQETANPLIMREAALWLILAVCILIFISYLGIGGYIGEIISDVSFGVFGITAYAFPFLLFIAAAFLISNKGSRIAALKFASSVGLYLCICSFAALFADYHDVGTDVFQLYEKSAAYKNGGGVVGGMICGFLRPALGSVGTGIILLILTIVFMLLITQKSFMRKMKQESSKVYQSAKESSARRKEAHRLEREKRDAWSMQEDDIPELSEGLQNTNSDMIQELPCGYKNARRERVKQSAGRKGKQPDAASLAESSPLNAGKPERTEIEVPVLFPVHSRESRAGRRVTGVTMDTKIQGNSEKVGAEIHEIIPKGQPADFMNDEAGPDSVQETTYIDLEEKERKGTKAPNVSKPSDLELYHEEIPLHIEGIDGPEPEAIVPEVQEQNKPAAVQADDHPEAAALDDPAVPDTDNQEKAAPSKRNPRSSQKEIEEGIASVEAEMAKAAEAVRPEYVYPPLNLLKKGKGKSGSGQEQEIRQTAAKLQQTLNSFGVHVTVTNVSCGPSVTRYELLPEQGVKVSRIVALSDDIKLNLAAADIRIEAPIPGKAAVGIEVPNTENSAVALRDLLESDEFQKHPSKLAFATGKDIGGKVVVSDIARMPHLLIAGATGSGKSVCINTLIMSILYKASPDEVKLIMIDPKVVELSVYNGIPHLFIPVVTDPKKAAGALNWGVAEMTDRYNKFAEFGVRDLKGYNQKVDALKDVEDENKPKKLPQIVIIVDELADLMMVAPGEVEDSICRLAQLARAAGIHLIIATQRPSVNVITGLIKANMPSRIAFSVSSGVDSRTIIDMNGAEKLLGKGDMLFYPQGYQKPARVQGAFVSDEEVSDVVDFLKNKNMDVSYNTEMEEQIAKVQQAVSAARGAEDTDALFADAGKFIIEKDKASIGMLQRVFKIGFNRAARIMDQLSEAGVVGPEEGTKPRKILMSAEQFENYLEEN